MCETAFGPDHEKTLSVRQSLAQVLVDGAELSDATRLMLQQGRLLWGFSPRGFSPKQHEGGVNLVSTFGLRGETARPQLDPSVVFCYLDAFQGDRETASNVRKTKVLVEFSSVFLECGQIDHAERVLCKTVDVLRHTGDTENVVYASNLARLALQKFLQIDYIDATQLTVQQVLDRQVATPIIHRNHYFISTPFNR